MAEDDKWGEFSQDIKISLPRSTKKAIAKQIQKLEND